MVIDTKVSWGLVYGSQCALRSRVHWSRRRSAPNLYQEDKKKKKKKIQQIDESLLARGIPKVLFYYYILSI